MPERLGWPRQYGKGIAVTHPSLQDNGYLHPESWKVLQVTAWIPLLNATTRNGCMQVIRGGHRAGKTCKHSCCVGGTWYVTSAASRLQSLKLEHAKVSQQSAPRLEFQHGRLSRPFYKGWCLLCPQMAMLLGEACRLGLPLDAGMCRWMRRTLQGSWALTWRGMW